jgi:hypothetical protein
MYVQTIFHYIDDAIEVVIVLRMFDYDGLDSNVVSHTRRVIYCVR